MQILIARILKYPVLFNVLYIYIKGWCVVDVIFLRGKGCIGMLLMLLVLFCLVFFAAVFVVEFLKYFLFDLSISYYDFNENLYYYYY